LFGEGGEGIWPVAQGAAAVEAGMTTEIAVVLDRSGSMAGIVADTIGGFNTFLTKQQAEPGECRLTLVQFDHEYLVTVAAADIRHVAPLTADTYVPRGTTALLDAMGRTIDGLGARLAHMPTVTRPTQVIVAVITDGFENASTQYTREQVFAKVRHQETHYRWTFLYLGANQDAIAVGRDLGIPHTHAVMFTASPAGMRNSYDIVSDKFSQLRSVGTMTAVTDEERVKAAE
jgi:hypothetical protein